MTIYSYVTKTVEQGGWTGVPRFDASLRRVFPQIKSVSQFVDFTRHSGDQPLAGSLLIEPDSMVITDNHLSLDVSLEVSCVTVHHGCARTHYDRDPAWRTDHTRNMVELQAKMLTLPNRTYVAPSDWVGLQFTAIAPELPEYIFRTIPHWVPSIPALPKWGKPKIIGDWRDNNKGAGIWKKLAERFPQWHFEPLRFADDAGRRVQYGTASLYLCLSLSEGGSYSVCDAEAAELPIVTTDVGNCVEFNDCELVSWKQRDNIEIIGSLIEHKLKIGRMRPSFYKEYTFECWKADWEDAIR